MEYPETKKIKVIITAEQFLYRLGIKTIISGIGIEPEIYETNSFESTKSCLLKNPETNYLVINEDVLPSPKNNHLNDLGILCPNCKLILVGNEHIGNCPFANCALNIETKKEMVERFQDFFFSSAKKNEIESFMQLSKREIDVLKTVAKGYSNKEIADRLFISTNTVITHRKNITDKLGIKTIAGLTVYAIMNNLINPEDVKK